MAWKDSTQDPLLRSSYVFGDKPYGSYWIEVPDKDIPTAPVEIPKPTLEDVVSVLTDAQKLQLTAVVSAKVSA